MAQFDFDATQHQPSSVGVGQLPVSDKDGWPMVIRDSELKATKDQSGGYLELHLEIIDGPNKGATGVDRLHIFNQSEEAKRIANAQMSAYCHVTGVFKLGNDGQKGCPEIHNIPFRAVVGLQKKKNNDDPDYTEVKGVKDINGNDPRKAQPPAQAQPSGAPTFQQPAQQQTSAAPWGANQQQQPAQQQQGQPTPWGGAATGGTATGAAPWQK